MNGSTFRLTLVDTRQNILAKLSGCQAPLIPAVGRTEEPEPFAKDSKVFVEKYLLQRDVIFTPRGLYLFPLLSSFFFFSPSSSTPTREQKHETRTDQSAMLL